MQSETVSGKSRYIIARNLISERAKQTKVSSVIYPDNTIKESNVTAQWGFKRNGEAKAKPGRMKTIAQTQPKGNGPLV